MNLHKVAHAKVQYAVTAGKLSRPNKCSVCGKVVTKYSIYRCPWTDKIYIRKNRCVNIIAHHEDYRKPLDVIWVCRSCHNKIHTGEINVS
jgi:predicted RNA-binding Zn-ribbon protein involved in translation (DUF1610 family)